MLERRTFQLPGRAVALVLAGGRGSRLHELTDRRAKPAVHFGGKFRIIDFALSNCVNSGMRRIGVVTQYKSHSLLRHLQRGWSFLRGENNEYVDLLPAQQRIDEESWYRGTADAVYQNLDIIQAYRPTPKYVVILAGDHVYKMNYAAMLVDHVESGAECSVACIEVPRMEATGFGVMAVDENRKITDFVEKPADPPAMLGKPDRALCSMGIYIFNAEYLYSELRRDIADPTSNHDFGKDIIPYAVKQGFAVAHSFDRSCVHAPEEPSGREHYWRDAGTIFLLGGEHRPDGDRSRAESIRSQLAGMNLPAAVAAGEIRAQPDRSTRNRDRVDRCRGVSRLWRGQPILALFELPGSFARQGGVVGAPAGGRNRPACAHQPVYSRSRRSHSRGHGDRRKSR